MNRSLPQTRLAPAAEKQSIWKRELSFGRKAENENAFAESAVDAEPTLEPVSFEHHDGDSELNANDSIAQAAVEATAEPVGGWTTVARRGCRTAVRRERGAVERTEFSTLSWQPAEASHVDIEDDVEPDWSQSAQADVAADEATVEEYEAETDERTPDAERQSIWKRELRFGRREAGRADDGQLERAEATPELADDTLTHDAPAEDTPAGPGRGRSRLGRSRGPRTPKAPAAEKSAKSAKGGKKLVGLKIGASQIAAAYVHSNGSHEVLKLARAPLERGVVVAGELRDPDALAVALKAFFNDEQASQAEHPPWHREQPRRCPRARRPGRRGPGAARQRRALPRAGGAADPALRSRPRLPRPA